MNFSNVVTSNKLIFWLERGSSMFHHEPPLLTFAPILDSFDQNNPRFVPYAIIPGYIRSIHIE